MRREDLPQRPDEGAPPVRFQRCPRVLAAEPFVRVGVVRGIDAQNIDVFVLAHGGGEVAGNLQLAAQRAGREPPVVIDDGQRPGLILRIQGVGRVDGRDFDPLDTGVQIAAVMQAGQEHVGHDLVPVRGILQRVVAEIAPVRLQEQVPPGIPAGVEPERAVAGKTAAQPLVAGLAIEGVRVDLIDARRPDAVCAVLQPLPPLALKVQALGGVDRRCDGHVIAGRQREVVGRRDADAQLVVERGLGPQKARLALHGRVGMREERQPDDRNAEEVEPHIVVIDHALGLIVGDAVGMEHPGARLVGILRAGGAGRIGAFFELRHLAIAPRGAAGGEEGLVRRLDAQGIHETVQQRVAEVGFAPAQHTAPRLDQDDVCRGPAPGSRRGHRPPRRLPPCSHRRRSSRGRPPSRCWRHHHKPARRLPGTSARRGFGSTNPGTPCAAAAPTLRPSEKVGVRP